MLFLSAVVTVNCRPGARWKLILNDYIAYYGTYTLDLKTQTVTHHLEDASPPNWRGVNNVRWFEFQGNDRLLLIPREDGKGGVIERKNATYKLLWERIK